MPRWTRERMYGIAQDLFMGAVLAVFTLACLHLAGFIRVVR